MNKEELLKKIDFEKSWLYECGIFGSDVDTAFHAIKNSVIEVLEQEPCEDCISRKRLKECFHKNVVGSKVFDELIDMQPSVNPQKPCEMTAEEYRQRMIQAFHNADCDELIAICVLPTEKEFEHLEWLLKSHYKKEPCEDAVSRQAVLDLIADYDLSMGQVVKGIHALPPVNPQKIGHWIDDEFGSKCSCCNIYTHLNKFDRPMLFRYCSMCGAKMIDMNEIEDKE